MAASEAQCALQAALTLQRCASNDLLTAPLNLRHLHHSVVILKVFDLQISELSCIATQPNSFPVLHLNLGQPCKSAATDCLSV